MTIKIVNGNLLESNEKYIAHICNCVTNRSASLAKDIFAKYPYADIYSNRVEPSKPGTIEVLGNGKDKRYIINMLGQYYPGISKYPNSNIDGIKAREKYFHQCLLRIAKISNIESIAFPFRVGCGIAGGNWDHYLVIIENFAKYIYDTQKAITLIYKLS